MSQQLANPYPGLRVFQANEGSLFFGRDQEAQELIGLVMAHQAVLMYGRSGTGKTSLIQASVIPGLAGDGMAASVVRVGFPVDESRRHGPGNPYVLSVLQCLAPEVGSEKAREMTLPSYFSAIQATGSRVLFFDQFEEFFVIDPDRWTDREEFVDQLCEALHADRTLSVVFSIREDYLAQMDPYLRAIPGRLRSRLRLEPLGVEAARAAVIGPARAAGVDFEPEAVEMILTSLLVSKAASASGEIREVRSAYIDLAQLQIVCLSLWQSLRSGTDTIRAMDVEMLGGADRALQDFYASCLDEVSERSSIARRDLHRALVDHFITPFGTRGLVLHNTEQTAGVPNPVIDQLENSRLIRSEFRAGARWHELTHDRLIPAVQGWGRQFEGADEIANQEQVARERHALEEKAAREERERSRLGDLERSNKRLRWMVLTLILLFLATILIIAWQQRTHARIVAPQSPSRAADDPTRDSPPATP